MPKLPTREEAKAIEERRLAEVWGDIGTAEDPTAFFSDLGTIVKAELSLCSRIRIAEAMIGYSSHIRGMLDAKNMIEARRHVKGVHREISDLQRKLAMFERQLANAGEGMTGKIRVQAVRECGAIYMNARQHRDQFVDVSGYLTGQPDNRLAEIDEAMWEAMWKIAPPFRFADCQGALAALDTMLKCWTDITGSQRGRSPGSKAQSDMIERLQVVFESVTGRSASAPKSGFESFIRRILNALPPTIYKPTALNTALPKRIRRISGNR